ncbi:hypothetical protein KDA_44690 [Dictyobacter alpinus]|uniref:Uncharacterized protein n=1 Tax=Dictyobacter alpinus TaxID=2014873 RepID=A0A402BCA1_9CHLR|nr:hypothetical protein [Dictyobacter alpinus]GCE28985.1 hypothetical protein KDA_44690 [Dictyobacter alpinus]
MPDPAKSYNPEQYFTHEQARYLSERQRQLGPERMMELLAEWKAVEASLRIAFEQGSEPADLRMQPLGRKAHALKDTFLGNNDAFTLDFEQMQANALQHLLAVDPAEGKIMAYTQQVMFAHQN